MKTFVRSDRRWRWLAVVTLVFCLGRDVTLAQEKAKKEPPPPPPAVVKFRPPSTGAPVVRLTGGSRGSGDATVTLDVLAPDDVGVTTQEQPSLFWFQSKPVESKFELTLLQ